MAGVAARLGRITVRLQTFFVLLKLADKSGVRLDDPATLPHVEIGLLVAPSVLLHQIRNHNRRAARDARKAVHQNIRGLSTAVDELKAALKMLAQVVVVDVVGLNHLVEVDYGLGVLQSSPCGDSQNSANAVLAQQIAVRGGFDVA